MLTPRDLAIVASVAHYYVLTRTQISRLYFPSDHDGRVSRKRLQLLLREQLLNRTRMEVVNPTMGAPAPVYYPSQNGCAWLAQELKDPRYLSVCTQPPTWQQLYHWVQVSEVHIMLDQAAALVPGLTVVDWLGEWSIANPDETRPEKRFRLFTLISENPRLVCSPDAGFLLEKDGFRKVFYVEADRDTTKNAFQVAASKTKGYAALQEQHLHRRHFPTTNVEKFTVFVIAPTPQRRDALRRAFASKPGAPAYKFASVTDLGAKTFLTAPVFYPCTGDPASLIVSAKGGGA